MSSNGRPVSGTDHQRSQLFSLLSPKARNCSAFFPPLHFAGFGRPSTAARPATGARTPSLPQCKSVTFESGSVEAAFGNNRSPPEPRRPKCKPLTISCRPGTSRPVTSSGRFVRLGTASLRQEPGGPFLDIERMCFPSARPFFRYTLHACAAAIVATNQLNMDLNKYVNRPPLARVRCSEVDKVWHFVTFCRRCWPSTVGLLTGTSAAAHSPPASKCYKMPPFSS